MKTDIVNRLREGSTDGTELKWAVTEVHLEAADELERLREQSQWRPISSAPKDEWLLGFCINHDATLPVVMIRARGMNKGVFSTSDDGVCFPTHWLPLPAPPPPETSE